MTTKEEIEKLLNRRDMAVYQRKITTQLFTVIEYDQEIGAIDRRIEQLKYKLKSEENRKQPTTNQLPNPKNQFTDETHDFGFKKESACSGNVGSAERSKFGS